MVLVSGLRKQAGRSRRAAVFRERVAAWWEGREPEAAGNGGTGAADLPEPDRRWTAARIEVAQRLWGREHSGPGGEDYIRSLLKPLDLEPSMAVLELGAGLGGATRLIHRSFGVSLRGLEADAELATAGMAMSMLAGLEKKAPVAAFDPDAVEIKPESLDRVIMRDVLHLAADRSALLGRVRGGLRRRGRLLLTGFALRDPGAPAAGHDGGRLCAADELRADLADLRCSIRAFEDETEALHRRVLDGWRRFQRTLGDRPLPPELLAESAREAERWRRCIAAVEAGGVRYLRILAAC